MRKIFLSAVFLVVVITLAACSSSSKGTTVSNTETTSSSAKASISEKEYASLIGTWECLDEADKGEKVHITKNDNRLTIAYADSDSYETEFVSKSEEAETIYYRFENKEAELGYNIDLMKNGNITLNFGTTNPEMTGLSKPMEYRRID
ncbi:hypothetical protein [Enterococcus sp. BWR-S5]|uniref:hypothetical protein n=1 Tax=Enterococcus sp. BWR-S5 TaxID=2787714 RepID=UPI001923D860|nr:hypothetical protein [Enterococcus sp. BWR-S5]MBL1227152.1 hypothetical protein [Enterococcus sp. BWR-S5]